jgi:hypothetical protein
VLNNGTTSNATPRLDRGLVAEERFGSTGWSLMCWRGRFVISPSRPARWAPWTPARWSPTRQWPHNSAGIVHWSQLCAIATALAGMAWPKLPAS